MCNSMVRQFLKICVANKMHCWVKKSTDNFGSDNYPGIFADTRTMWTLMLQRNYKFCVTMLLQNHRMAYSNISLSIKLFWIQNVHGYVNNSVLCEIMQTIWIKYWFWICFSDLLSFHSCCNVFDIRTFSGVRHFSCMYIHQCWEIMDMIILIFHWMGVKNSSNEIQVWSDETYIVSHSIHFKTSVIGNTEMKISSFSGNFNQWLHAKL